MGEEVRYAHRLPTRPTPGWQKGGDRRLKVEPPVVQKAHGQRRGGQHLGQRGQIEDGFYPCGGRPGSKDHERLEVMLREIGRMGQVLEEFRGFSRPLSGLTLQPTDLARLRTKTKTA